MAQVKFILKEPNSKEKTLVYLVYRFNNQKLKYSFNEKIFSKFWNPEKQRAKETKAFTEYPEFNSRLDKIETNINTIYRQLLNDDIAPTPSILREKLNASLVEKQTIKKQVTFFDFIDELIANSTKKRSTIIHYNQSYRVLKEYCLARKRSLSFEDINLNFYEDYLNYLREREYAENTIGGYIKHVKSFMNEAFDRQLTNNVAYKSRRFKKTSEVTDKIYLNLDEIERLYALNLSYIKKWDNARDLFIIGCYTGLRFSDLAQIKMENFTNDMTQLKVRTEKTGEFVVIPLHKTVKEIIKKYNNAIPRIISNEKMNEYLKNIAKLAKLNEKIPISMTKGGIKQTEVFEKHKLVTVHTARRSFATNMYLQDVPTLSIIKITGHRTERAFMLYIKISQEENATKLLNHPFFQQ